MFKWCVLFCLVQALVAYPGVGDMKTQDEVEEFKNFLKKTQEEGDKSLGESMAGHPNSNAWENSGKYQGDILLMDEEIDALADEYANPDSTTARNGVTSTARRWPGNVIPYEIAPGFFNNNHVNMIDQAAAWFHQNTCVRWVRRTNQRDFVRITGRPTGCYANVGYWPNHIHTLNLAVPGCMNRFIIIHEMLHIVGFNHMHQNFNRNDWVIVHMQNVIRGMEHNFNMFSSNVVSLFGTQYEYASNQHYGPFAFSSNNQPTVQARFSGGNQMGQLHSITAGDTLRVRRMYNCPGAWSTDVKEEELNKSFDEAVRVVHAFEDQKKLEQQ